MSFCFWKRTWGQDNFSRPRGRSWWNLCICYFPSFFQFQPHKPKNNPPNSQQYFSCSAYTLREKQRLHRKPLSETNSGFHLEPTKKMKHPCIVASFRWSWWTLTYLSQYSTRIFRKQNNHSTNRSRLFFFFSFLICSFWTRAFNKKS